MPRLNGTGPMGMGPKTGRAQGRCTGAVQPETRNPAVGYGRGRGCGGGRGMRGGGRSQGMGLGRMGASPTTEQAPLEAQLTALQARLERLEAEPGGK